MGSTAQGCGWLQAADVAAMHACALTILDQTGLLVRRDELRAEVVGRTGFIAAGERVRVSPEAVTTWLTAWRREAVPAPAQPSERHTFSALGYALWTVAAGGGSLRPLTRDDVIDGCKLLEVLADRGVRPGVPGAPQDVPERLRPFEQYLIGAEYSSAGGTTPLTYDVPTTRLVRDLDRVYGRPFHWSAWLPNPLVFGGSSVDLWWHFADEIEAVTVGTMPTMGFSAPCDPVACLTLALAEVIGGAAIIHALRPQVVPSIFPHPQPGDMRTGTLVLGTPEADLLDLLRRDVLRWYGSDWNTKQLNTSASLPTAQAQIERAQTATTGVVHGFDTFHGVGVLGLDEVFCPAQALLDLDMVGAAARVARGPETAPGLELDRLPAVVAEVVREGGLFAMHDTTVTSFRRQYFDPQVLRHTDRAQWLAAGHPTVYAEAEAQAARLLTRYQHEPDAALLAELHRVYEAGRARLA